MQHPVVPCARVRSSLGPRASPCRRWPCSARFLTERLRWSRAHNEGPPSSFGPRSLGASRSPETTSLRLGTANRFSTGMADNRWAPSVDKIIDDLKVGDVLGEEGHSFALGGGCDHEVYLAPSWVAATACRCGGELAPDPGDLNAYGEWVECRFDDRKSGGAARQLIGVVRDENTEVQLGDRSDADSGLDVFRWGKLTYQHRRVEDDPHEANGSTTPVGSRSRSASRPRGAFVRQIPASVAPLTQRRRCAGPNSATGRPATVTVRVSPASARRSTSPTWLRSSFCAISLIMEMVAELLPLKLEQTRKAATALSRRAANLGDVAAVLSVSHQLVHQLVHQVVHQVLVLQTKPRRRLQIRVGVVKPVAPG